MENYFYEIPRLPMFLLMEDLNIARVRVLMYKNGKLEGALVDWDADILDTDFSGKEHFNDEFEEPFYCLYKDSKGVLQKNNQPLVWWAKREAEQRYKTTKEDIIEQFMEQVKQFNVPVFETEEEARKYVFQR